MAHNNRPRIGIDARFYGPVGKGLGRYVERLLSHLESLESDFEYVVFLKRENWDLYRPINPRFKKVLAPYAWYSLDEQIRFPVLLAKQRLDLVHFTHFNVPLWYANKFVVTLHDLILTKFPTERASTLGPFVYRFKHVASQFVLKSAIRRAVQIITVSKFSAAQIEQTFQVEPAKITVILEGCELLTPSSCIEPPRIGHGIPDKSILYVGNAYPHKNVEKLIDAWALLRQRGRTESLILVGKMDYFFERLRRYVIAHGYDRGATTVIFPGYVTDGQLRWLYQHASIYAFPSLMEGFGLPGLEAMLEGLPVVSSDTSSLPEIFGDGAEYFDPQDPVMIADAISKVLDSPVLRQNLIMRGKARAEKYRWDEMAKQTLQFYQKML